MDEQAIKKGFNNGYLLKTYMPGIADKLALAFSDRDDDYAEGFKAGIQEREQEFLKKRSKNYDIQKTSVFPKQKAKDKGKDKGDRNL